jgi:hypothetical protein
MLSRAQMPFGHLQAELAFDKISRARRRAVIARSLKLAKRAQLDVLELGVPQPQGLREIPLDAIVGTLEPSRAAQFDADMRPLPAARPRWQRIYAAEQNGEVLPPISVTAVADGYAIRDGHHRVSVARARGAETITALVD